MVFRNVLILSLLISFNGLAQNYTKVDSIVTSYPQKFSSTVDLAHRIATDFNRDEEKVRAIYQWLSTNIRYGKENAVFDIGDVRIVYSSEEDLLRQIDYKRRKKIKKILNTNRAECLGYTEVFKAVCDHLGIQSEIVFGYGKTNFIQINSDAKFKNHSWNAVKIGNKWQLLDITWSTLAQIKDLKQYNDYYFFVNPEELILTHFPANKEWQLLEKPVSKADFFKAPIFYANYFIDKFKISNFQDGTIEINDNRAYLYFDKIPKSKRILYTLDGEAYRPLVYKKTKKGNYIGSFKYKKTSTKNVTIYSDSLPVLSFAINANTF